MASAISHGIVGLLAGWVWSRAPKPARFWVLSAACAIAPDADVAGFVVGIKYGDFLGHRGFSHSFLFAAIFGIIITKYFFKEARGRAFWQLSAHFALVTASHSILDAMTNGGLGVAFFSPFDLTRYFFEFRPVVVSPIGVVSFFSEWGWNVVKSEVVWIILPAAAAALLVKALVNFAAARRLVARTTSQRSSTPPSPPE